MISLIFYDIIRQLELSGGRPDFLPKKKLILTDKIILKLLLTYYILIDMAYVHKLSHEPPTPSVRKVL